MTWLIVTEHTCHKRPRICSTCRKHFPVLSSFMTYPHIVARIIRQVPLMDQGLLPFRSTCVHSHVLVRVTRSLVLCIMFCRPLFVLLSCFFWSLCCLSWPLCCLSFFWSLCCLSFFWSLCCLSFFWSLCCLSFFDLRIGIFKLFF